MNERTQIPEALATLDSMGESKWHAYTVSAVNFNFNGAPILSGRYFRVGRVCHAQVRIEAATALTTYAASSYITLPISSQMYGGMVSVNHVSSSAGLGTLVTSTGVAHMPDSGNVTRYINVYAVYEI